MKHTCENGGTGALHVGKDRLHLTRQTIPKVIVDVPFRQVLLVVAEDIVIAELIVLLELQRGWQRCWGHAVPARTGAWAAVRSQVGRGMGDGRLR
jgi:hypothetical protein